MSSKATGLLKTLRDAAVVVASILIAFALEAWWDEQQLSRDVQADLANIGEQLLAVESSVDEIDRRASNIINAGSALLAQLEGHDEGDPVAVTDTLLWWGVRSSPSLDVSIGAVTALIASGRIGAVQDPQLRLRLANLQGQIDDVTEDQAAARQHDLMILGPLLSEYVDQAHLDRVTLAWQAEGGNPGRGEAPTFGSVDFPNLLQLRNAVRVRLSFHRRAQQAMGSLRDDIAVVRQALTDH